jgi:NitT/TauT family transport system ATP-binding protein
MSRTAIELCGVSKTFGGTHGRSDVVALAGVTFSVAAGEFVSIVGPSGCGKSTVLSLVAQLAPLSSGRILINGAPPAGIHPDLGYVFQRDTLLPWRTVIENVWMALELKGVGLRERRVKAQALTRTVGLESFEHHYPHELSGGMRKRCELIRTLIRQPSILLMDEPFGALDAQTRYVLQEELIRMWSETHSTILFVTHDIAEAIALSDRVLVMSRRPGRVLRDLRIGLPRPRSVMETVNFPEYAGYFNEIWGLLREQAPATAASEAASVA